MRAVVKVKQSQGRGPSNAARYIAESKIDPKREGKGPRPLFTNRGDDDLKYGDANRYLKDGRGRPAKGDLIHFLASFHNEDFVPLGATDEERKERLREAAREAMEELKSDLRIADWRWVAAIHLNTKNPHIHFLIYKETKDDKGERLRLGKIPKRLLPRSDQSSDGRTIPVEGDMSRYFVEALDRELDRAREACRERQESPTRMANGRLEAGAGINKESSPPSPKPLAEPSLRDPSAGQLSAIRVVNRKHFEGSGGENEVYIGRATARIKGSILGNPYRIGRDGAREEVIEKYDRWLSREIAERGDAYSELRRLAEIAKTGELVLVCWCAPEKCHGEIIKSEIESINRLRNRGREAQDMSEILSHSLEFDTPLIHQGIEYRTVENFYQAMKTPKDDLETRRKIAAALPEEARTLGEQVKVRQDWPEIHLRVLETALRHKFAPGTKWHARLRATGDTDILDGSKENHIGNLLMRLRESREKVISSDEILLEANKRNPSLAGRELVQELILRGPAPEPVSPPDVLGDIREALKDRQADDPYYNSQPDKADWLGEHSQDRRDLYERRTTIKGDVLVIPAEGHELNNLTADRAPFINERRYAHQEIPNSEKADDFYNLAKAIAGKTANTKAEIDYFRCFYKQIKHDREGRYIKPDQKEAREEALERTLAEMRPLAADMEKLETLVSIEARRANVVVSLEQVREAEFNAYYDDEDQRRLAEGSEIEPDLESEGDDEEAVTNGEHEDEHELEIDSFAFNTAARKVDLSDERLRFPAGLTFEDRKSLVEIHLPNVDAKIEAGRRETAILGDINRLVEDWNRKLSETGAARQKLSDKFDSIGYFIKAYVKERFRDPETRALNVSEAFRNAHERITDTRTPEELNRAASAILKGDDFSWRERALLFFGRASERHTREMRELRHSWGLTRDERAEYVRALGEGRRSPSPALDKLLTELETRTSSRAISHYRASILNEEMRNPGKLDLRALYERLPAYERDYLYKTIEERAEAIAGRQPSLRESAPELGAYGESFQQYSATVSEIQRRELSEAIRQKQPADKGGQEIAPVNGLLTREERLRIRIIAANLAWDQIEPREILTNDPAVIELLSLSDAVARLRDEAQPRAREAAGKLDEFIRSRNLDRAAEEKTDYYYRADQIPKGELEKLSPADKLEFAVLEQRAGETFRDFKEGFGAIDKIRIEIDQARNGARSPAAPGRARGREIKGQHIDSAGGRSNRVETPVPDPGRERMNDRSILGNAIIAHVRADSASFDYEIARNHGRTFRFNIRDESVEANRRISDLDVHRRADVRGDRAADERGAERKEDRLAIRGQISEADIRHHSTTLEEHGRKLGGLVKELESRAKDALDAYQHSRRLAGEVVEKYQKRGEAAPAPFVEREALVKTQDDAIERRFAGHTERLERLRVALAEEHGQPVRPEQEAARLAAQLFTARTELQARVERASKFDETRHLRQWEIQGEKLSLADIDRLIEQATDKAQFVGKRELHIFPGDRKQASAEIERLGGIRQEVVDKIVKQQDDLRKSVSEAGKLLDPLSLAYDREASLREQSMPDPQFTRQELERAADNIETARDATLLRLLSVYEGQFKEYADPKERFKPAEGWGRAPARELVAEILHDESVRRLTAFHERGSLQPLLIETSGGLVTHRFKDTEPRSLIEVLARPIVETPAQREIRHIAQAAFAQSENRLQADVEKTGAYLEAAREIALSQAAERSLRAGRELPMPDVALTPKQAMIVEIHAERQTDPEERGRLLALARGSALSHFDSHSHSHTRLSETVTRDAASGMAHGR